MILFELTGMMLYAFWGALFVISLCIGWLSNKNHTVIAAIVIGASLAAMNVLKMIDVWSFVADPQTFVIQAICWLGLGIVWSLYKWQKKLREDLKEYSVQLAKFLKSKNVTQLTDDLKYEWTKNLKESPYSWNRVSATPESAFENKERICNWIIYWPFSIIGEFISEWLFDGIRKIVTALSGLYDTIAKSIFKNASDDMISDAEYNRMKNEEAEKIRRRGY